ncbi:MAG: ferrochelatase, partial [Proteobacteria bacterium]|nr:ferrochelatase [Pseudomonadota bacterium]
MKHNSTENIVGVICINLGTPVSPKTRDVRRYLREFFRDQRLISPALVRFLISTIVPWFRATSSAKKYQAIWQKDSIAGSPLLIHSLDLSHALTQELQQKSGSSKITFVIKLAMNYGSYPLEQAVSSLVAMGAKTWVVIPLFPHYASCTYGGSLDRLYQLASKLWYVPAVRALTPFYRDQSYIHLLATRLTKAIQFPHTHTVISFHGLPLKSCLGSPYNKTTAAKHCGDPTGKCCQVLEQTTDFCYRKQCWQTTELIRQECGIDPQDLTLAFQSRVGPEQWTTPDTLDVLKHLATEAENTGIKHIVVMCPSFITDCLETLEEIHIEAR